MKRQWLRGTNLHKSDLAVIPLEIGKDEASLASLELKFGRGTSKIQKKRLEELWFQYAEAFRQQNSRTKAKYEKKLLRYLRRLKKGELDLVPVANMAEPEPFTVPSVSFYYRGDSVDLERVLQSIPLATPMQVNRIERNWRNAEVTTRSRKKRRLLNRVTRTANRAQNRQDRKDSTSLNAE